MKTAARFVLLYAIIAPSLLAQTTDCCFTRPFPQKVKLSASQGEKLLIHRVEPTWQGQETNVHVSSTVVLVITVAKSGHVQSARVISGPAMILQVVLDAVRQWEYRPYQINGKPVEFSTRVSVPMSTY
jgi:protein TonB